MYASLYKNSTPLSFDFVGQTRPQYHHRHGKVTRKNIDSRNAKALSKVSSCNHMINFIRSSMNPETLPVSALEELKISLKKNKLSSANRRYIRKTIAPLLRSYFKQQNINNNLHLELPCFSLDDTDFDYFIDPPKILRNNGFIYDNPRFDMMHTLVSNHVSPQEIRYSTTKDDLPPYYYPGNFEDIPFMRKWDKQIYNKKDCQVNCRDIYEQFKADCLEPFVILFDTTPERWYIYVYRNHEQIYTFSHFDNRYGDQIFVDYDRSIFPDTLLAEGAMDEISSFISNLTGTFSFLGEPTSRSANQTFIQRMNTIMSPMAELTTALQAPHDFSMVDRLAKIGAIIGIFIRSPKKWQDFILIFTIICADLGILSKVVSTAFNYASRMGSLVTTRIIAQGMTDDDTDEDSTRSMVFTCFHSVLPCLFDPTADAPSFSSVTTSVNKSLANFGRANTGFRAISEWVSYFYALIEDAYYWNVHGMSAKTAKLRERFPGFEKYAFMVQILPEITQADVQASTYIQHEIINAYTAGQQMLGDIKAAESDPTLVRYLTTHQRTLSKYHEQALIATQTGGTREAPVTIYLYGNPGTGKSVLTDLLTSELYRDVIVPIEPNYPPKLLRYSRNVGQAHWDNYKGQYFCIYDDFGQKKDSEASPNEELYEIIQACNTAEYALPMASLDNKGKAYFKSKVIIASSNSQVPPVISLNSASAVYRRFNLAFEVTVDEDFGSERELAVGENRARRGPISKTPVTTYIRLDKNKTGDKMLAKAPYRIRQYDMETGRIIGGYMNYNQFYTMIQTEIDNHTNLNEKREREMAALMGITYEEKTSTISEVEAKIKAHNNPVKVIEELPVPPPHIKSEGKKDTGIRCEPCGKKGFITQADKYEHWNTCSQNPEYAIKQTAKYNRPSTGFRRRHMQDIVTTETVIKQSAQPLPPGVVNEECVVPTMVTSAPQPEKPKLTIKPPTQPLPPNVVHEECVVPKRTNTEITVPKAEQPLPSGLVYEQCVVPTTFNCDACHKKFKSRSAKYQHMDMCMRMPGKLVAEGADDWYDTEHETSVTGTIRTLSEELMSVREDSVKFMSDATFEDPNSFITTNGIANRLKARYQTTQANLTKYFGERWGVLKNAAQLGLFALVMGAIFYYTYKKSDEVKDIVKTQTQNFRTYLSELPTLSDSFNRLRHTLGFPLSVDRICAHVREYDGILDYVSSFCQVECEHCDALLAELPVDDTPLTNPVNIVDEMLSRADILIAAEIDTNPFVHTLLPSKETTASTHAHEKIRIAESSSRICVSDKLALHNSILMKSGGCRVNALFVMGRIVLVPHHLPHPKCSDDCFHTTGESTFEILQPMAKNRDDTLTVRWDDCKIHQMEHLDGSCVDLMLVSLPTDVPSRPTVVKHFVGAEEMAKATRYSTTITSQRLDGDAPYIHSQTTNAKVNFTELNYTTDDLTQPLIVYDHLSYKGTNTGPGDCGSTVWSDSNCVGHIIGMHVAGSADKTTQRANHGYAAIITREFLCRNILELRANDDALIVLDFTPPLAEATKTSQVYERYDEPIKVTKIAELYSNPQLKAPRRRIAQGKKKTLEKNIAENGKDRIQTMTFDPITAYEMNGMDGDIQQVGYLDKMPAQPTKTVLTPSILHATNGGPYESKYRPAALGTKYIDGIPTSIAALNLAKIAKPQDLGVLAQHRDCLSAAVTDVRNLLKRDHTPCRVLTYEESIKGVPGDEYRKAMDRSTSPGLPFNLYNPMGGKKEWLGEGDEYITDHPELLADYNRLHDAAKRNIREPSYFMVTCKDELKPNEKVDQCKTRTFGCGNMTLSLLVRQYYLDAVAKIQESRIDNEICVGSNVFSQDWDKIKRKMLTFPNAFAGDFSNFDGSLMAIILHECMKILDSMYPIGTVAEQNVRRIIAANLINALVVLPDGSIILQTHSQPSGNPLTVILNSIFNMIVMRWSFYYLQKRATSNILMKFENHVAFITYGDDNAAAVSTEVSAWYNQQTVTVALSHIGLVYTDEKKSGEVVPFRPLEELGFLKRSFKDTGVCQPFVAAPLDMDTLERMIQWTRGTDAIGSLHEILRNWEMELALHGKQSYDAETQKVGDILRSYDNTHYHYEFKAFEVHQSFHMTQKTGTSTEVQAFDAVAFMEALSEMAAH